MVLLSAGSGDEAGEGAGIATTTSPQEVNSAISAAGVTLVVFHLDSGHFLLPSLSL